MTVEQFQVDAAYAAWDLLPPHKVGREGMRKILEAAASAKPPEDMVVTHEMTNAGYLIAQDWITRGCTGSSQLWCMANYIYRAMYLARPKVVGEEGASAPEITDEVIEDAMEFYNRVGGSWQYSFRCTLKYIIPKILTRPTARAESAPDKHQRNGERRKIPAYSHPLGRRQLCDRRSPPIEGTDTNG